MARGKRALREALRRAGAVHGIDLAVGIQATDAQTAHGTTTLLVVAATNEFGSEDGHTPERSYLRSTGADRGADWYRALRAAIFMFVVGGDEARLERDIRQLGVTMTADVRQTIVELREPPNAPSTIARKGSDNPLIDTDQLVRAIRTALEIPGYGSEVIG